ncbi:hypothetical protein JTE90_011255 [Oedothorax gibbosus]|uniref:OCIA domain-containing protein n=1 Tax=Oedothorax gibbosus TaxID=931172 RepID=A0AAV6VY76_9ARAC|nr:hypothetical protein JTE90_011255 [Oedothorax gibbosus]
METDSPVVYHGTSESRFPPEQIKKTQVQLTPEEIRILRECNKESFYYRCLPLAVAGIASAFLGVRNGYLTGHPRWGPAGKMTGGAILGWFVGKFSYRSQCEEKFLKLENSAIGDAVRKKRGISRETFADESFSQFPEEEGTYKGDSYKPIRSDFNSSTASLNLDMDKNIQSVGLDDRNRPSTDNENANFGKDEPIQKITSYEDLRRRNREEYERQHQLQSQQRSGSSQMPPVRRQWGPFDSKQSKDTGRLKKILVI